MTITDPRFAPRMVLLATAFALALIWWAA